MNSSALWLMTAFSALLLGSASGVDPGDKSVPQDVTTLLARSEALQAKRQFAEAERMIRQFLTIENILPTNKMLALNALGALMTSADRCDEAEKYFHRALDLAERNPAIVPVAVVRMRLNLAAVLISKEIPGLPCLIVISNMI